MTNKTHPAFKKEAEPFYDIIMKGLAGAVDGAHFWDAVAEDAVFEFMYRFPGFPEKIEGRAQYMDWFGGYSMKLTFADGLAIHLCADPSVIVLEYAVHGATPAGKRYDNRFCSIITLRDRKIVHWRDYMDSLAVTRAL